MKRGLVAVAASAALIVGAVVAVFWVPGIGRAGVERALRGLAGRPVEITGRFELSAWPRFTVVAEDIRIPGSLGGPDFLRLKRLDAEVSILSLLAARIDIAKLALIEPSLRVVESPRTIEPAGPRRRDWRPRPDPDWGIIKSVRIGEGRITGGQLQYVDAVSRRRLEFSRVEATLGMPEDGGPFAGQGTFLVNGQAVDWKLSGAGMRQLMAGSGMKIAAEAQSQLARLTFQGTVGRRQLLVLDGKAEIAAASATALDRWIGPIFASAVDGSFEAEARFVYSGARFAVEGARLTLGEMRAQGDLEAAFVGDRISFSAHVAAELLDLTPFLSLGSRRTPAQAASPRPAFLGDADIRIEWQALKLGHLRGGQGRLTVKGGRRGDPTEAELAIADIFGGEISGRAKLMGNHANGSLEGRAVLARLKSESILAPLVGDPPVAGTLNGTIDAIAEPGTGSVIDRLAIKGAIAMPATRVLSARLAESLEPSVGGGRELADLSFRFATGDGRVSFEDIIVRALAGTLVGGGELDLASGRLDLVLRRPTSEGELGGMRIVGPWDSPAVTTAPAEAAK